MIELAFDIELRQDAFVLKLADRSRVEVLGLVGPSGAGKTTLLEAIAGLRPVERGEIQVAGRTLYSSSDVVDLAPRNRRIGYVPQDTLLFPHLGVRANLLYGARAGSDGTEGRALPTDAASTEGRGFSLGQAAQNLAVVAEVLEIGGLLDRRVQGLSGGERQRVAIGRALMAHPALLLLDEPLAAVDRPRRERILPYLLRIRRGLHVPLIYVTHDVDELRQIADRVLVIEDGRVVRVGSPEEVL